MYIKLTQLNGKPIWFNQDYIVTVEPSKGNGALVVPLGDGLDYEVLESPAAIVESLGGSLTPSPPAVSLQPPPKTEKSVAAEEPSMPEFRIDGGLVVPVAPDGQQSGLSGEKEEAPVATKKKRTTAKRSAKSAAAPKKKASAEKKTGKTVKKAAKPKSTASAKKALPPVALTDEQLVRLQKMSPGSMRKLVNTLMSQFAVAEATPVVDALMAREIISVTDQGHVDWKWRQAPLADVK